MKFIGVRCLVFVMLSTLSFPAFSGSGSEYGDIIKEKPEYKKITKEKKKKKKDKDDDYKYHDHRHYHDPYYRPVYRPVYPPYPPHYYRAPGSRSARLPGLLYLGINIGESEFDYDDIDNGDASIFYIGFRPEGGRLGYELSFYDSGDSEVTSLTDIELQVDTVNLVLTVNSSINNKSPLNWVGKGGIYFADTTLSGPFDRVSESSNGFLFGAGVELVLSQHFSLSADIYHLNNVEDFANDESVSILTVGGHFIF